MHVADWSGVFRGQTLTSAAPRVARRNGAIVLLLAIVCNAALAAILPPLLEGFGAESGRLAASVASGNGFSSPYAAPSGPSAWVPPMFPYLLAGIFRVFGVNTLSSYIAAIAFNILVHAITCLLLYKAAGAVFGRTIGFYSACALASFPLLFYPLVPMHLLPGNAGAHRGLFIMPNQINYSYLTELAIVVLIWYTLFPPHWSLLGISWGVGALTNPCVLVLAPAFFVYLFRQGKGWRYIVPVVCAAAVCVAPWSARNYRVFHRLIPIRDNFGVELKVGNQPGQKGMWKREVHPAASTDELNLLSELGEARYIAVAKQEALQTIRAHPAEFAVNTIRRIGYWWMGTPAKLVEPGNWRLLNNLWLSAFSILALCGAVRALRNRNNPALLFVALMLFYPMVFYVTHTFSLVYMYPIHPEMLALATSVVIRERPVKSLSQSSGYVDRA